MEFKEIDHLFDTVFERLENKAPLLKGPYETYPLGQDHFLLNKSWAYFKERIKNIETQYEEQLEAKREEIAALKKEMGIYKDIATELESKNSFLSAFQETFVKSRSIDFMDFQKSEEKLKNVWEEERLKLENKILAQEHEINRLKGNAENQSEEHRKREKMLQKLIDDLKNKIDLKAEEENEKLKEITIQLMEKEEVIQNRENKIELLKGEIGRTNGLIKNLKEEIAMWERRAESLIGKVEQLQREMDGRGQKLEQLSFRIDALQREKAELKQNWEKEEASWRELWDRVRILQEKENRGR